MKAIAKVLILAGIFVCQPLFAQEITLLWQWIKSRLEEDTHGKAAA